MSAPVMPSPASTGAPGGASGLREAGYALLERFVSAEELPTLQREVNRVLRGPRDPACERPHNTLVPLRWNDPLVDLLLSARSRVGRLTASLAPRDLRFISAYISIKEPRSEPLCWHQDWWCWDHPVSYRPEAAQVAVLCYLTATDEQRAALRVIPGSHHRADEPAEAVTLALAAGDAVAIDYRLLHSTHPNLADLRRDCLILNFAPAWRELPAEIRGHLIRHPALPVEQEPCSSAGWAQRLLPSFAGPRHDLPLSRSAPPGFAITG